MNKLIDPALDLLMAISVIVIVAVCLQAF